MTVVGPEPRRRPGQITLYEQADRMLDAYLDRTRAIDQAILVGFDRDEPVDLDAVIATVGS